MSGLAAFAQGAAALAIDAGAAAVDYLAAIPPLNWVGMAVGVALALILNRLDDLRAELRSLRATVDRLGARR